MSKGWGIAALVVAGLYWLQPVLIPLALAVLRSLGTPRRDTQRTLTQVGLTLVAGDRRTMVLEA
jgi:hypothetical protein